MKMNCPSEHPAVHNMFACLQFATYTDGVLAVTSTPFFPRLGFPNLPVASQCASSGCTNCLQPVREITLAYKPGDIVIAALVNAHEMNMGLNCGEVIPDRLIDAVAARYAVDSVSTLTSRGVSVGYLIVDVCPGKFDVLYVQVLSCMSR